MSVVAWDGRFIAADKQATNSGLRIKTTKMRKLNSGEITAWTGDQDSGLALARWYEAGASHEKWPDFQKDKENWTRLIVAGPRGVVFFEQQPEPQVVEEPFMAWGSGRDFAMGALAHGATAEEAVIITCRFCITCGLGVDVIEPGPAGKAYDEYLKDAVGIR